MAQSKEHTGGQPRLDRWQYDFLKQCSKKGEEGIKEWNEWRKEHPTEDICLDGQDLSGMYLRGINLMQGRVGDAFFTRPQNITDYSGQACLRKVDFRGADCEGGSFAQAHLEESNWESAKAQNADFHYAVLQRAHLSLSSLDGCRFDEAVLAEAQLTAASIRGTKFIKTDMRGCTARTAVVDGATEIWECSVDTRTDFTGVGLEAPIIDPATKQLLEYNIRRMHWEEWLENAEEPMHVAHWFFWGTRFRFAANRILRALVRRFWEISDYGMRTKRVIRVFFEWAIIFAAIYYCSGLLDCYVFGDNACPGFVSNLFMGDEGTVPLWLVPVRAVYFSVVTMTTLGFGDMHANCQSFWGHVLLTLQVLLGYVLLGALVTRFAVLFTAGGPAGRFADGTSDAEGHGGKVRKWKEKVKRKGRGRAQ